MIMNPVVHSEFKIEDLGRPLNPDDVCASWEPQHELVEFRPPRLDPAEVVGMEVLRWTNYLGTYGMGGPGFFGLLLGDRPLLPASRKDVWLVVALWGAGDWIYAEGRPLSCPSGWRLGDAGPKPWTCSFCDREKWDELSDRIVGTRVVSVDVTQKALRLELSGLELRINEDPASRNNYPGAPRLQRAIPDHEDLRDGVFLAQTPVLWI